jgi:hypothetical protein
MSGPPDGWTAAERDLWQAVAEGASWPAEDDRSLSEAADATARVAIRGEALRYLLVNPPAAVAGNVPQVRLHGVRISATLALSHATIAVPTSLRGCHFDEPVDVSHAIATSLDLAGSHVPGLPADGVTVAGDLRLAQVRGGSLGLFGAHVRGNLWLNGAVLSAGEDAYALNCPQLRVGGGLYAGRYGGPAMSAVGGVNVWGTDIGYSMELDGACLTRRKGFALRGHGLKVGHDLSCAAIEMPNGGMVLFAATIGGQVWLNGSQITANDGEYAISAPMLRVTGGVYGPDMKAHGGVNLFSASVGESVSLGGSALGGGPRHALRAPGAVLQGDLDLHNTHVRA